MKKSVQLLVTMFALVCVSGPAMAQSFRPFTAITDVCPDCPKRASDTITLNNSTKIKASVVAENDDFFVLSRYGEVRVLAKTDLQSIEWANGSAPSGIGSQDQILLRSNHVLTGSIIEENQERGYYRLQSSVNKQTFVVFMNAAEAVYKGGRKVN